LTVMIVDLIGNMPALIQFTWVQSIPSFLLSSMWIYTTQPVTGHIYGTSDPTTLLYNEGADWVTLLFGVYNGVAALVAFLLPVIAQIISRRGTHFLALCLGGCGLISVFFITEPALLLISMIGVGIAWASILSMPYAMLSGSLPASKMGYYMGVFRSEERRVGKKVRRWA